jgi:hypothetical protein
MNSTLPALLLPTLARVGYLEDHRVSVGTGGSAERMQGPCACPDREALAIRGSQDKHKAPAALPTAPCPYRTKGFAGQAQGPRRASHRPLSLQNEGGLPKKTST